MKNVLEKMLAFILCLLVFLFSVVFVVSSHPSSDSGKLFSFFIFLIGMVALFGFMSVFVDMLLGEKKEEGKEEEEKKKGSDEPEERKGKGNEENEIY